MLSALALLAAGKYFERRGRILLERANDLDRRLDLFIADCQLSAFCCKSIVYRLGVNARCECFLCRRQRSEPVTETSQELAERVQQLAMRADLDANKA